MSKQPPKFEEIKKRFGAYPKSMMVNEQVAKTMPFKTQTRRLDTNWKVGDVLWIREPVKVTSYDFPSLADILEGDSRPKDWNMSIRYLADNSEKQIDIPSRYIEDCEIQPKWIIKCQGIPNGCIKEMARTFVRVVEVREEMLQDISEEDCLAEGIQCFGGGAIADTGDYFETYYIIGEEELDEDGMHYINETFEFAEEAYEALWDSTAPKGSKWEDNPKVKAVVFERLEL